MECKFIKQTVVFKEWALGVLWPNGNLEFLKICRSKSGLSSVPDNYHISDNMFSEHCRKATKKDFERMNVDFHPNYLVDNFDAVDFWP